MRREALGQDCIDINGNEKVQLSIDDGLYDIDARYINECLDEIDEIEKQFKTNVENMKDNKRDRKIGQDWRDGKWQNTDSEFNLFVQKKLEINREKMKVNVCEVFGDGNKDENINIENECGINFNLKLGRITIRNGEYINEFAVNYFETGDIISVFFDIKRQILKFYKNLSLVAEITGDSLPQLNCHENEKLFLYVELNENDDCVMFNRKCVSQAALP